MMIWLETRAGGKVKGMGLASPGQEWSGSMGWGRAVPSPWRVRPWLLSDSARTESESRRGSAPGGSWSGGTPTARQSCIFQVIPTVFPFSK